ncbi:MAG: DUF6288 domain-containing protein [Lentisphaeria bacterium]|nr:DUF6288 domain-containing protein [Lentisphaeria bacterium]
MMTRPKRLAYSISFALGVWVFACLGISPAFADERDADAAMEAATNPTAEEQPPPRPEKMPDLTKGDPLPPPGKGGPVTWNMGPTGIVGIKNGGNKGDQVQVISVLPGSPAEGKILPGDVLLGVGGTDFVVDGDINRIAGNAIIDAETEEGKGALTLHIWRDQNWTKRNGAKDVFGVDIEELFEKAENSGQLYEWKDEEAKTVAVKQMDLDEFPIDGVDMNIDLQLEVMGTYSETSPWDCPVIEHVRKNALKVIAAKFSKPDGRGRLRVGWPDVLALVASGNPEYVELAKTWVHSQKNLCQDMDGDFSLADLTYRGMQSWRHGFEYLEMAIYYDATGDTFVLPEIRKRAILVALGQNGGGSWGHTFAFQEFNGGLLHRNNPGYGGMNNAGTRCFFLLTLAKKFGVDHPEVDAAIERSDRFFSTFVDKGCIPYGYHPPWASDDSNGKNYGAAYAFYVLGEKYKAKFFGMHSAHASFTRRGGHGSPTLWYYTPLSANLAGPKAVQAYMRNMRYFYTLSRRHDGSFIFLGEQAPGIGGKGMRNPTATVAMHLSRPLEKLIITGKDADPNFYMTDEEFNELLISARGGSEGGQIKDPKLLEEIGEPWNERGTDELINMLDHFFPKARGAFAAELGKRYAAGEKDILTKVLARLDSDEARMRDGACLALSACGKDDVITNLAKVSDMMLNDEAEFVRMTAANTIGKATEPNDPKRELAMLEAAKDEYPGMTMDNGNVRNAIKNILFARKRRGDKEDLSKLATEPFKAGFDEYLVRRALEKIVTMDPQGAVPGTWDKEALLKLAGPVTFSAEVRQVNDAMFGGARKEQAQALLNKFGYREAIDGDAGNLRQRSALERGMRMKVGFKDPNITPKKVKQAPGAYRDVLDDLYLWLQDNPTLILSEKVGKNIPPILTPLDELVEMIEADEKNRPGPSIRDDVFDMFETELANAGDEAARINLCREELKEPARKNYFRQMAAMTKLVEKLGAEGALNDVLPYVGHQYWGVRNFTHDLALKMIKDGAEKAFVGALTKNLASGEMRGAIGIPAAKSDIFSGNTAQEQAVGILTALADAGAVSALEPARQALTNQDPVIRGAAIQAVMTLGGDKAIPDVFTFLKQTDNREDLQGCEKALLSRRGDADTAKRVRSEAIALLTTATIPQRRALAWIIAQIGGPESLAALKQAAEITENETDLQEIIRALAYCPDRGADQVLLDIASVDKTRRQAVALQSVHRMVGRNGTGDVTDERRLDFATPLLRAIHDPMLITYLGKVHTGRSCSVLLDVMKQGGNTPASKALRRSSTGIAAEAIISAAEGMENPPPEDAKAAADALTEVIEYIEVTQLRGGAQEHMRLKEQIGAYTAWKTKQARAGKALLKVHKPTQAPIDDLDDLDLDL